jgi:hypothetical protein
MRQLPLFLPSDRSSLPMLRSNTCLHLAVAARHRGCDDLQDICFHVCSFVSVRVGDYHGLARCLEPACSIGWARC